MKLPDALALLLPIAIASSENGDSQVLEVYHVNPYHLGPYPINMNSGDATGDLFFDLKMVLMTPIMCTDPNSPFLRLSCKNQEVHAPDVVVNKLHISVRRAWSGYAYCNVGLKNNSGPFGDECPHNKYCCVCGIPYLKKIKPCHAKVGKKNVKLELEWPPAGSCNATAPEWLCWQSKLTDKLSYRDPGYWYSTLDYGYCPHHPGRSQNCTWQVTSVDKIVNKTCHSSSFIGAVETYNRTCFEGCGPVRNVSSPCWVRCFYTAVLGPDAGKPGGKVAGIPLDSLVQAWTAPFQSDDPARGGCPELPISSAVSRGPARSEVVV
mmetsp:Transcript_63364/g.147609  ORF Transcript_63364/g.147609 Transcript_63364/m.147609 type:complete len:321 (+) Transcript_63364:58-1020(+)